MSVKYWPSITAYRFTLEKPDGKGKEMGILDEMTSFFEERPVDELMSAISEFPFERTAVRENSAAHS